MEEDFGTTVECGGASRLRLGGCGGIRTQGTRPGCAFIGTSNGSGAADGTGAAAVGHSFWRECGSRQKDSKLAGGPDLNGFCRGDGERGMRW